MGEQPLFLERKRYRTRRLMDVVRVVPFVCAVLWIIVPLMWPVEGAGTTLSSALRYVFAIWLLAITACFALWRRTRERTGPRG
ncbi:hypothetical protein KDD17_05100 [Sulfitobacter albidus]|uniref:Uncharacterized protein n=1 Tax=Sulfitobacter albidus TaxID=2829501 RepID=A0A975JF60_9RHOB|nr:hypothetical protein [Sulfitobacter albidus]QUJ77377.1 hypothetical protein KDD17_05100 [Sulfitobacter albidus]